MIALPGFGAFYDIPEDLLIRHDISMFYNSPRHIKGKKHKSQRMRANKRKAKRRK